MKRFITYLYEYDHGNKTKNVGFIRVDIRETIVNIEVCIKNFIREAEEGKIYVLIPKATFTGIELGKINLRAGQYNKKFSFDKNDLADSGNTIHDVVGMAVCFDNNEYLASCWKDEWAEEIANGKFSVYKEETISATHSYNFLKLFNHIKDNQIFYKTFFKLNFDYNWSNDYLTDEMMKWYGSTENMDYHLTFFKAGLNAIIQKWLDNNCKESPEEIEMIIKSEYKNKSL